MEETKEGLKAKMDSRMVEIEKNESQIRDHEYKIEQLNAYIDLNNREEKIKKDLLDKTLDNFEFSEHWKPIEKFFLTEEYLAYAKELKKIQLEMELLKYKDANFQNKLQLKRTLEDLDSLKTRLVMVKEELKGFKEKYEGM